MINFKTGRKQVHTTEIIGDFISVTYNTIKIDRSFQRNFVWNVKQQREFIESIFLGRASSVFTLTDIASSITPTKNIADKWGEKILEEQYKEGKRLSVLDGQNRILTMINFVKDKFSITGLFYDGQGNQHNVINKKFSELDTKLQTKFCYTQVALVTYIGYPYEEYAEIFLALQGGVAPNNQEKRHAISTPISDYADDAVIGLRDLFERCAVIKKKISRMYDQEVMMQAIMSLIPSHKYKDCKQSDLDNFYNLGKRKGSLKDVPEYNMGELKRAYDILLTVMDAVVHNRTDYSKVSNRQLWALIATCEYLYDNNLRVKSDRLDDFYKFVYDTEILLIKESKARQALDAEVALEHGADDPPDSQYYWYWSSLPASATSRNAHKSDLVAAIEEGLPQEFLVSEEQREEDEDVELVQQQLF